jgi:hypothetical protein
MGAQFTKCSNNNRIKLDIDFEQSSDITVDRLEDVFEKTLIDFTTLDYIDFNNCSNINFMNCIFNGNLTNVLDYLFEIADIDKYNRIVYNHFAFISCEMLNIFIKHNYDFRPFQIEAILAGNDNINVAQCLLNYISYDNSVGPILFRERVNDQSHLIMFLICIDFEFTNNDILLIARKNKNLMSLLDDNAGDIKNFAKSYVLANTCQKCNLVATEGSCMNCRVTRVMEFFNKMRIPHDDFEKVN